MVITKKIKIHQVLVPLLLVIFPLGQLLRMDMLLGDFHLVVHPLDFLVGLISFIFVSSAIHKKHNLRGVALGFITSLIFSFLFSFQIFKSIDLTEGVFYLLRILAYFMFALSIKSYIVKNERLKETFFNLLIGMSLLIALFGWIQYVLYPDVRVLYYLGWDDHLYRIVGTFLDPGFTSILILFGINLVLVKIFQRFKLYWIFFLTFLLSALFFTYARAGYVALAGSLVALLIMNKKLKLLIPLFIIFTLIVLILPRPSSSGVQLERLYSVLLRIKNYQETLNIWTRWPLFGVGYNNMCTARIAYLGEESALSHSCSGSDSSLLLILATTGFVGLVSFLVFIKNVINNLNHDYYGEALMLCLVSLLIHSLFVNSLFYPWVMAYMGILYAVSSTSNNEE
jgi:hypothetical protein